MKVYNFQDYLRLTVDAGDARSLGDYLDNEYARVDATNRYDTEPTHRIDLHIVDELPTDLPDDAVVRTVRFKKLFTFRYAFVGAGTPATTLWFVDHPVRRIYPTAVGVFLQAQVLEPLMYWSFLLQDVLFMHSAGVSRDGAAYVFPAYGGTGKTTTCMTLLAKGYGFLGDDLLIVDPERRRVFPYPRPLHIFTYNVRNLHGAKIPLHIQGIIYFKDVLRFFLERVLRTEFLISTRVHADRILPDFELSEPAELHNVIFLKKDGDAEQIDLAEPGALEEHAARVVESADLNESLFEMIDDARQADVAVLERRIAAAILERTDRFGYLNTRAIDLSEVDRYLENVETNTP